MFKKLAAVGTATTIAAGNAMAALPAGVDTAISALGDDAATLAGYVAPVMLAILGFTVGFKLIKRFTNKL